MRGRCPTCQGIGSWRSLDSYGESLIREPCRGRKYITECLEDDNSRQWSGSALMVVVVVLVSGDEMLLMCRVVMVVVVMC